MPDASVAFDSCRWRVSGSLNMLAHASSTGVGGRGRGGSVGKSIPFVIGRVLTGKTGLRGIVFCRRIPGLDGSGGNSFSPTSDGEGGGTG